MLKIGQRENLIKWEIKKINMQNKQCSCIDELFGLNHFRKSEAEKLNDVRNNFEVNKPDELELKRKTARHYCYSNKGLMKYGQSFAVTMDDVNELRNTPVLRGKGNNINGNVFQTNYFEWTGEWYKSNREGSHNNLLKIWRIKEWKLKEKGIIG